MAGFVAGRLLSGFLVLIGVSVLVFFLFQLVRFNPAYASAGESATQETIDNITKDLGLDLPIGKQLLLYINDLSPLSFHNSNEEARNYLDADKYNFFKLIHFGESVLVLKQPYLGRSFQSGRSVAGLLNSVIPNTLVLALTAIMIATIIGVILGVFSAVVNGSSTDRLITTVSVLGISFPSFFAAIVLQLIFAYLLSEYTGLHLTGNLYEIHPYTGETYLAIENLLLPALALGIRPIAVITQITRSSMMDVLHADYIRTAKAKGLSNGPIVYKHALKNAFIPVLTSITGWLASLLAGAFFIEVVFNYNGLGLETVNAIRAKDIPVATGAVMYIAIVFIVINLITDILYSFVDPRVSVSKS